MISTTRARKPWNRKWRAKPYATLSLQFSFGRDGVSRFHVTSNTAKAELKDIESVEMSIFAMRLFKSDLLDDADRRTFSSFCMSFLRDYAVQSLRRNGVEPLNHPLVQHLDRANYILHDASNPPKG